jgi:hypothetical protein
VEDVTEVEAATEVESATEVEDVTAGLRTAAAPARSDATNARQAGAPNA